MVEFETCYKCGLEIPIGDYQDCDELKKRLKSLEDAIEQSVETGKDALWWKVPWVENETIQQAIRNSQERRCYQNE